MFCLPQWFLRNCKSVAPMRCLFVSDAMRKGGIVIKNVKGLLLWAPGVKGGESQGDFSELANRKLGSCRSWELEQTGVSN